MAQMYAGFSVLYGWISNTFPSPAAKRAVAVGLANSISQLGNICGSCVPSPSVSTNLICEGMQVHMADVLGADVPQVVRGLYCRDAQLDMWVLHLEAEADGDE